MGEEIGELGLGEGRDWGREEERDGQGKGKDRRGKGRDERRERRRGIGKKGETGEGRRETGEGRSETGEVWERREKEGRDGGGKGRDRKSEDREMDGENRRDGQAGRNMATERRIERDGQGETSEKRGDTKIDRGVKKPGETLLEETEKTERDRENKKAWSAQS